MGVSVKELEVGDEIPSFTRSLTLDQMRQYSGWPERTIHTDEEVAKSKGLPGAIAEGMMTYGYLQVMLVNFFGDQWLEGGHLSASFTAPAMPGDTVTAKGVVKAKGKEASGTRLDLEVWCENQNGRKLAVGTASGKVS